VVPNVKLAKGIVLWDMDGTLISPIRNHAESPHVNAVHRNGFKSEMNQPGLLGSTDYEIILKLAYGESAPVNKILEKCFKDLDELSLSLYHDKSFSLCKGFPEVLAKVTEIGWENGILTGNTKTRLLKKLEILKITDYFNYSFMFSCNFSESREDIAKRAKKALTISGYSTPVIVGDTPRDVGVAQNYGFKSVAVGTGSFSLKELSECDPNLLLTNFQNDLKVFLDFIRALSLKH